MPIPWWDWWRSSRATWQALTLLGHGFILSSVLWGTALVAIIDRRLVAAGLVFAVASLSALCGLVHSPAPGGALFRPRRVRRARRRMLADGDPRAAPPLNARFP